ncbi:hypothetical protein AVEN_110204-1 [Araneus ventricosus]|uniref:Uncharacterized protein n=1 Tax=Araneus ventricosus TaxID=182803 RepID=A0A4Y2FG80_ARAVE|nr:hypothetical protein AVEN_110204-1 [Araneus ventricosus]
MEVAVRLEKLGWEGEFKFSPKKQNSPLWGRESKRPIVHCGTSVNDPPKSIDLNERKANRSLGQMEWSSLLVNAHLKGLTQPHVLPEKLSINFTDLCCFQVTALLEILSFPRINLLPLNPYDWKDVSSLWENTFVAC